MPSRGAEKFPLSQFQAHQFPDSSEDIEDRRTAPGTACKWWNNLETLQPLLWSDEYLPTGGMLIPSVLSQTSKHIWCSVAGISNRSVCFQRMPAVYWHSFVHMFYSYVLLDKKDLLSELCKSFLLLWSSSVTLWYCIVCSSHSDMNKMFQEKNTLKCPASGATTHRVIWTLELLLIHVSYFT